MARIIGIVGKFHHEGVSSALSARDLKERRFNLYRVSPEYWKRQIDHLTDIKDNKNLSGIILHLPSAMVLVGSEMRFREQWLRLIDIAAKTKSIAFIYTDNLKGLFRPIDPETSLPMLDEKFETLIKDDKLFGY